MDAPQARRVVYRVAASLDGLIAGPNGEFDWIPADPDIDFKALFAQFDTFLVGRRTFEAMGGRGTGGAKGTATYVFSTTLRAADHPGVTLVADRAADAVREIKARPGKDIWLFGGGALFRSLAAEGLVDRVEVAVVPVLLGAGVPLFPSPAPPVGLALQGHRVYPKSGIVLLEYSIQARS